MAIKVETNPWSVLTGSWQKSRTKLTISFKMDSICWWQPSPIAESAIRPACLYLQSAVPTQSSAKINTIVLTLGMKMTTLVCVNLRFWSICIMCCLIIGRTILPPRPQAILSRALSPATALLKWRKYSVKPNKGYNKYYITQITTSCLKISHAFHRCSHALPVKIIIFQFIRHRPILILFQVHHHRQHLRHWEKPFLKL